MIKGTTLMTGLFILVVSVIMKLGLNMLILWGVSALWGQGWDVVTLLKLATTVFAIDLMLSATSSK